MHLPPRHVSVLGFSSWPTWAINWKKDKLGKQDMNQITDWADIGQLAVACVGTTTRAHKTHTQFCKRTWKFERCYGNN